MFFIFVTGFVSLKQALKPKYLLCLFCPLFQQVATLNKKNSHQLCDLKENKHEIVRQNLLLFCVSETYKDVRNPSRT